MTEQPPSAEALEIIDALELIAGVCPMVPEHARAGAAREIDALIAQRVSTETERCVQITLQYRAEVDAGKHAGLGDPERALGQCYAANLIGKRIRAPAERPAPEPVHLTLREQGVMTRALLRSTRPAPEERAASPKTEWMVDPPRGSAPPDVWTEDDIRARAKADELVKAFEQQDSLRGTVVEQPTPVSSGEIVRWGVLRLLSGDLASDDEKIDAELDLDDFQFWFQEHPKHTGFKQILINLSGEQWGKLKELPLVEERSPQPPPSAIASTGEQPERGWVLVPREPTDEMLSAGDSMMPQIAPGEDITTGYDALAEAWPAMIAARPAPPSPAAVVDYTERALHRRLRTRCRRDTRVR